jgi:multiple sugar transport system substrate-binding protein
MPTASPRLVVSASLAVMLAAAPAATAAQDEPTSPAAPIEGSISVFGFGYETGDEVATVRVDHFREAFPGIDVRFSESGWDEQQFLTALSSSAPPDVVNIPRNVIGTYIARGVLQPVDECMAQQGVDPSVYRPAALAQVTADGAVYGFPQFFNTRVWLVNEAAFDEAGLSAADFDWSDWEAIAEVNEQLTRMEGGRLAKIGIDPKLPEFLPLWAKANGVELLSSDGRASQLDDPRIAEALAFAASLHEPAGGQAPFLDFRDTWDFFGAGNQFASDQLAAFPMEQWYLNVLADVSPDVPLTVAPFVDREGTPLTWADGDAFAIVTDTPNAEAACAFAATMTEADAWIAAARSRAESRAGEGKPNTGVYTANREADEVIFGEIVDLSDMPRFEAAVQTVLETQEHAFAMPPSAASAEFAQAWRGAVEAVTSGGSDPEAALAQAHTAAQAAIDAAGQR